MILMRLEKCLKSLPIYRLLIIERNMPSNTILSCKNYKSLGDLDSKFLMCRGLTGRLINSKICAVKTLSRR